MQGFQDLESPWFWLRRRPDDISAGIEVPTKTRLIYLCRQIQYTFYWRILTTKYFQGGKKTTTVGVNK